MISFEHESVVCVLRVNCYDLTWCFRMWKTVFMIFVTYTNLTKIFPNVKINSTNFLFFVLLNTPFSGILYMHNSTTKVQLNQIKQTHEQIHLMQFKILIGFLVDGVTCDLCETASYESQNGCSGLSLVCACQICLLSNPHSHKNKKGCAVEF